MFPTFISILDIQSWWEVPSIAHFCSLFRTAFNLLDFDIEDLEEALLTDGTEETSWLQELIVRLLSGCLPNNEISTFNYQMFLRRLFRQKCQEHERYNPFNTDVDFQLLPLRTKVDILHALCDFRLDADDVLDQLKNLEAESLRVEPLGYDCNDSAYWYFYGTRLYREDFKTKNNKKKSVWQVICFTEDDWFQLNKKFKKSTSKSERQLHRTLTENFLPELPRLFREKERLARKRLLESQPRRTSNRLKKTEDSPENAEPAPIVDNSDKKTVEKQQRNDMAGNRGRPKKTRGRQRKQSESPPLKEKRNQQNKELAKTSTLTTVGRQTNNSLSAATGEIVIQPLKTPHKKKLKTSQVFRQTDEDLLVGMHKILDYVKSHEDAWPFADPVDEEYAPNYYTVIRKPMDLQRMEDRLDSGYYSSYSKFRDDFQLIVDNCRLYNGVDNEYTEMVDSLSKVFERATEKYLDQISSSDDEIAVEYQHSSSKDDKTNATTSKRKPALSAKTNRKRERSPSEEPASKIEEKPVKKEKKTAAKPVDVKKAKVEKTDKSEVKNQKGSKKSPTRNSRSGSVSSPSFKRGYSSSPPPSDASSGRDSRFDFFPKKHKASHEAKRDESPAKNKSKSNHDKHSKEPAKNENPTKKTTENPPKPADKHNTLRETIEKLKAKSEIGKKITEEDAYDFDLDTLKENKSKKPIKKPKKPDQDDSEKKAKKPTKNTKDSAAIEALTLATEQTLKDINKWLDDTPKCPEYSSASNSPSYTAAEEPAEARKPPRKDTKDLKRRMFARDPAKFIKRREIQRTIDRLQPGKSKGNLITNVQTKTTDDSPFPQPKPKDSKNALIVKTDDNAPKLSLGTVLDSFGRHNFTDPANQSMPIETPQPAKDDDSSPTPNLSAWFKAFGAPKVVKKTDEEVKSKEVVLPEPSPTLEAVQPQPRQRRVSTGSSVSERSSFSQDMDSPRVGIDERLGAYPAPYPSPMHRSPSGASPGMLASPNVSPKTTYPPFNGQMTVGFYQDTVSNKSSPEKACSPQYGEHVYAPEREQQTIPYIPYYNQGQCQNEGYYDTSKSLTDQYQANKGGIGEYSSKAEQYPSKPEQYPNKAEQYPTKPEQYPGKAEQYTNKPEQYTTKPEQYTSKPEQFPTKANIAEQYPKAIPEQYNLEVPKDRTTTVFPVKKRIYNDYPMDQEQMNAMQKHNDQLEQSHQMQANYQYGEQMGYNHDLERKLEMGKYTNMGYGEPDYGRSIQQYNRELSAPPRVDVAYNRPPSSDQHQQLSPLPSQQQPMTYKDISNAATTAQQQQSYQTNTNLSSGGSVTMPRPTYNRATVAPPANLTQHVVDRFNNNDRILTGLQTPPDAAQYYDKGLTAAARGGHMFNKAAGLATLFNQGPPPPNMDIQAYNHQNYNRQLTELQNATALANNNVQKANNMAPEVAPPEKKTKKRKTNKNAQSTQLPIQDGATPTLQGFHSYSDLKAIGQQSVTSSASPANHLEPSAISLKTASVVPGSAFNFGPAPHSTLALSSAIYAGAEQTTNLFDDYRTGTNYYLRPPTQAEATKQNTAPQYPFMARPGANYPPPPLAGHFGHQGHPPPTLMEYNHYLQAGVLNQGLLGAPPPGPYPGGYHPLSMRQQYDSMTRPPWL